MEEIRINKYISKSGVCSRRAADKLINEGHVTINGVVAETGSKVTEKDIVRIDDDIINPVSYTHLDVYKRQDNRWCESP